MNLGSSRGSASAGDYFVEFFDELDEVEELEEVVEPDWEDRVTYRPVVGLTDAPFTRYEPFPRL